ncbi:MAG: YceI family protein [Bacteroidota bacterium]
MKTFIYSLLFSALLFGFHTEPTSYQLDIGHTYIGFDVERFWVGEVSGRFNEAAAHITMTGEDISTLQVDATIQSASLDSNNDIRDGHLKGQLWLDAETHPTIHFKSTNVSQSEEGQYLMEGDFTIKGITNQVSFPIEVQGPFKDPTQNITLGLKAEFTIDRFDYGLQFNKTMDNGELFIGREVKIKIRALAIEK